MKPITVEEAKHELKYVSSEISALTAKRKQLESFISLGQLLGGKPLRSPVPETSKTLNHTAQTVHPWPEATRKSTAQNALDVLKRIGHPMKTSDIVEAMAKQGTPIRGQFQRASLRSTLCKKTNIFESITPGVWALREWPADLKQLKQSRVQ